MSLMRQLEELAEQKVTLAAKYEPVGVMEVIEEYEKWPDVLRLDARAARELHAKAQAEYPLHPAVVDLIEAVHRTQLAAASAAEQIARYARALHSDQIEALEDRRQAMWDHRANQDRR